MEIFILVAAGVIGAGWYFSEGQRVKRQLKRAPRLPLGELPEGRRARVVGAARVLEETLEAPLTGRKCVYFDAIVEEDRRDRDGSSWHTLIHETKGVPFVLDDGTGTAIVDPGHARVALDFDARGGPLEECDARAIALFERHGINSAATFRKDLRYREAVVEIGEQVAVLGEGVREPDPTAQPAAAYRGDQPTRLRMTGSARSPLLISDNRATAR